MDEHRTDRIPAGRRRYRTRRGFDRALRALRGELGKLIVGQDTVVEQVMLTILAGGNSLIVGVPGLAKTLLIHSIAQVLDLRFSRIQFTPDLMPSDITGTDLVQENPDTGKRELNFLPGPIFANIVLADEINRTPPKTQSALLEAMQEHRVTVQGKTYELEEPFFVFATQNPIELEGTYPLPEAQLDRFMFEIIIDYLSAEEELEVVRQTTSLREIAFEYAMNGDGDTRLSATGAQGAGIEAGVAIRARPGALQPPGQRRRARFRARLGRLRRQHPRRAIPGARRQGARADQRPLPRRFRRYRAARQTRAQASGVA